ncbi:AAA family ATPase [Oceanospirillum phage vB_OliS_GJ44]|nr:AAA family ATPase [Oceanospirillum phage vB_OliS_GJ44]
MSNLIEIEQQVIGGLIMSPSLAKQITLEAWHFSSEVYSKIYSEIQALITENTVYDVITVAERLEKSTGMNYLPQCIDASRVATVKVDLAKHKAEIVRKQAIKRKAMMIVAEGNNLLSSGEDSAVDFIISELMALDKGQDKYEWTMQEAASAAVKNVEDAYKRQLEGGTVGIPTGLSDINRQMGGFHKSDLVIIGARPAQGKTAVSLNMMIGSGVRAGFISSEQGHDQIGQRCLSIAGGVNSHNMRSGKMQDEDWSGMIAATERLLQQNCLINDNPSITVQEVIRQARKWKHQDNIEILFIDYAQRIRSARNHKNITDVMGEVIPALKSLARELDIPVVVLAQVKREVESRNDKRPLMGDLADASIMEKEADQVIMLYRDEVYNPDTEQKGIIELLYEKNRHGPTGRIKAAWRGEFLQVRDLAPEHFQS